MRNLDNKVESVIRDLRGLMWGLLERIHWHLSSPKHENTGIESAGIINK